MAVLLGFAFLSGLVTVLSPCILPVLPIVLSGSVGGGRARPLGVLAGFVVSFAAFTLSLTALVRAIGISPDALRIAAIVIIAAFGLVMLVPALAGWFERATSRISGLAAGRRPAPTPGSAPASASPRKTGFLSGIPVGLSLGLVWTPCVGPIMASVVSLALTERVDGGAVAITLAYTLGTSLPMLAVMLGGRALLARVPALTRNVSRIQKGFGVVMILVAVAIGLGWDRQFQAAVLRAFPGYGAGLTAIEEAAPVREALGRRTAPGAVMVAPAAGGKVFSGATDAAPRGGAFKGGALPDYGTAPGLVAAGPWFNTGGPDARPLTMESLRGKVVIVDFWTYSCINCIRTLPYLRAWYDTYRDKGLVIVGVHTPEFEFEKNPANVQRAVRDLGVTWPVVQDNDYAQWTAYANRYWPAHYFIDAEGRVRAFHFGEGGYEEGERIIQALLKEAGTSEVGAVVSRPAPKTAARTPETYLGYMRARGFVSTPPALPDTAARYEPARVPGNGEWSLRGSWTVAKEFVVPEGDGVLELGFDAANVFLVVEPAAAGAAIEVRVDGKVSADTADVKAGRLIADESRMYHLVGLARPGRHLLRLEVHGAARLFAFTFG
jgi:cytochrome c biogenesis protein CcdA/thiol-disulfide isomerase/thioredoxin